MRPLFAAVAVLLLSAPTAAAARSRALITGGPPATTESTSASFAFAPTSPALATSFECRLDAGPWMACVSPVRHDGLLGGPHIFEVRLNGLFTDRSTDRRSWVVERRTEQVPCSDRVRCPNPGEPVPGPAPPDQPGVRRDAQGCAYGANTITEISLPAIALATVCVLNAVRGDAGLRPLGSDRRLRATALHHARDMTGRGFFAHVSPGGGRPVNRVGRSGYLAGASSWAVGEVLAYQRRPTAESIVAAWMRSPPHRRVILTASYRDVGVGAVHGRPQRRGLSGGTFAALFGSRASRGTSGDRSGRNVVTSRMIAETSRKTSSAAPVTRWTIASTGRCGSMRPSWMVAAPACVTGRRQMVMARRTGRHMR